MEGGIEVEKKEELTAQKQRDALRCNKYEMRFPPFFIYSS